MQIAALSGAGGVERAIPAHWSPAERLLCATVGYRPNPDQRPILIDRSIDTSLLSGGFQSGKSQGSAWYLELRHMEQVVERITQGLPLVPKLYWLIGASYSQTRQEFEYIRDAFMRIPYGDGKMFTDKDMCTSGCDPGVIKLRDGSRIETKTYEDAMKIAGARCSGVLLCEGGQMPFDAVLRSWERTSSERGWVFISGTMEKLKYPWFPRLLQSWRYGVSGKKAWALPTWTNIAVYPGGRNDPQIIKMEQEMPADWFQERVGGEPCKPSGLVIPEFGPMHVQECSWDGKSHIKLWEDPGYGPKTLHAHALYAVQFVGDQVQIFDEIYENDKLTEQIIEMAQFRPWWKAEKKLTCDPQYKTQHHSMPAVGEVWYAKAGLFAHGERHPLMPGIERLRTFLKPNPSTGKPALIVDPNCKGLLSEFGMVPNPFTVQADGFGDMHPWQWKLDKDGQPYGSEPDDKHCDGIKAVIYGLVEEFGFAQYQVKQGSNVILLGRRGGMSPVRSMGRA